MLALEEVPVKTILRLHGVPVVIMEQMYTSNTL